MKFLLPVLAAASLLLSPAARAQQITLTKLFDFQLTVAGVGGGPSKPNGTPIAIGNELWFTTEKGGFYDFGSLAKFNLTTKSLTMVFSELDNSGNTPLSSFTPYGDLLFYTTSRGGTAGDRGALSVYNKATNTNTALYGFPITGSTSTATEPNNLEGRVTIVESTPGKLDLYYLTKSGGPNGSNGGTVSKSIYDIATNTVGEPIVLATMTSGATAGRQPNEGMTRVGNKLYFTTLAGGPTSTNPGANLPNGAGWLYSVDITTGEVTPLANPGINNPGAASPGNYPTYDPVTNALYYTTLGGTTKNGDTSMGAPTIFEAGAIMKYDLTTNTLTAFAEYNSGPTSTGDFSLGRSPQGSISIYEGFGYYTTLTGGAFNQGTIARINLLTGEIERLFSLTSGKGDTTGSNSRDGFAMVADPLGGMHFYATLNSGGANNAGTIVDLYVTPEPTSAMLCVVGLTLLGSQRRRPRASV